MGEVESMQTETSWLPRTVQELLLLLLSALAFGLSFPNILSDYGWFPLGFIALIPLFVVIHRCSWPAAPLYGLLYGFVAYGFFNFWLAKFHPLTIFIVPPIYSAYFLLVFPILKAIDTWFPRLAYLPLACAWVGYEYLKIRGFLGYPWGVMGYSQYQFTTLIQISAVTGVWGVSLLLVFPSALLGHALRDGLRAFRPAARSFLIPLLVYGAVLVGVLAYGAASQVDYQNARLWRVALIQQNADPWKTEYEKALAALVRLSNEALKENPDIVVWSETSFVPGIDWHTRYRTDRDRFALVRQLRDFLSEHSVPFLVGNDDGQLRRTIGGEDIRVDYNAALLYERGVIRETYRKLHLVPFTEHFPFESIFPRAYRWLESNPDVHWWERGTEYTVFETAGIRFSALICFEDSFGYLSRRFVQRGAQVLVNLTNDAWSNSTTAEVQHMSMAVFRAIENRRSMVRSTNGGITATIDPNGRIVDSLEPFIEGYLVSSVPVLEGPETIYTRWGDWLGVLMMCLGIAGFAFAIVRAVISAVRRSRSVP